MIYRDDGERAGRAWSPTRRSNRWAATTPAICGSGCRPTRTRPGAGCSPSRTTATCPTGSCSRPSSRFTGKPVDLEYAETRAKWEPLYEATQIKGDGEAHPFLSPNDEFADYETWDQGNLDLSVLKQDDMLQYEYARSALQIGLQLEQETRA